MKQAKQIPYAKIFLRFDMIWDSLFVIRMYGEKRKTTESDTCQ